MIQYVDKWSRTLRSPWSLFPFLATNILRQFVGMFLRIRNVRLGGHHACKSLFLLSHLSRNTRRGCAGSRLRLILYKALLIIRKCLACCWSCYWSVVRWILRDSFLTIKLIIRWYLCKSIFLFFSFFFVYSFVFFSFIFFYFLFIFFFFYSFIFFFRLDDYCCWCKRDNVSAFWLDFACSISNGESVFHHVHDPSSDSRARVSLFVKEPA